MRLLVAEFRFGFRDQPLKLGKKGDRRSQTVRSVLERRLQESADRKSLDRRVFLCTHKPGFATPRACETRKPAAYARRDAGGSMTRSVSASPSTATRSTQIAMPVRKAQSAHSFTSTLAHRQHPRCPRPGPSGSASSGRIGSLPKIRTIGWRDRSRFGQGASAPRQAEPAENKRRELTAAHVQNARQMEQVAGCECPIADCRFRRWLADARRLDRHHDA